MPGRAIGLTWAGVDPGDRRLDVALGLDPAASMIRPRQRSKSRSRSPTLRPASRSTSPWPRSISGSSTSPAINRPRRTTGTSASAVSAWRSATSTASSSTACRACPARCAPAATAPMIRLEGPPPTEDLVAFYSEHRPSRRPTARRPSPSTSRTSTAPCGSWRWPGRKQGVGHAVEDVLVRDPVVMQGEPAALPRARGPLAPAGRAHPRRWSGGRGHA